MQARYFVVTLLVASAQVFATSDLPAQVEPAPILREVRIPSSMDGEAQPVRYWAPDRAADSSTPLLVFLHSWSGDYTQDNSKWLKAAAERGWIFVHPNFRGRNDHPEACGSRLARQDVIDALNYSLKTWKVDRTRIYLCGVSGGGHMTMLMAAYYPDRFSAASAWVGISDLAAWHEFHKAKEKGRPSRYAIMMEKCMEGRPGDSKAVDAAYRERSPLFHLRQASECPLDINTGVNDGHTGSVPVSHSLKAFNEIARARKSQPISDDEIGQLTRDRKLKHPLKSDQITDSSYGRAIFLRRESGPSRVTVFDGGHESVPGAALNWLSQQKRPTRTPEELD